MAIFIKESIYLGLAYSFRVHYPYGREHSSTQIDMVAEKSSTPRSEGSKERERGAEPGLCS